MLPARLWNRLSFLHLLAVATVACSLIATPIPSGEEAPDFGPDTIDFQIPSTYIYRDSLQEIVNSFNEEDPSVIVVIRPLEYYYEDLITEFSIGASPDVFVLGSWQFPNFVQSEFLLPVGDHLITPEDFYPVLREAFTANSTIYCRPQYFSALALVYNKDMFNEVGLLYPTELWTWSDLRTAIEALTNSQNDIYGMALSEYFIQWSPFLYQAGGSVWDGAAQITINSQESVEAMDFYAGLIRDGLVKQPSDLYGTTTIEVFGKHKAAMIIASNEIVPIMRESYPDVNYGVIGLPSGPAGKATNVFATCFAVSADTANLDASIRLIEYLTSPMGMMTLVELKQTMPARSSLRYPWLEQQPEMAAFLDSVDYAHTWKFFPGFPMVENVLDEGMRDIFAGTKTPQDVLSEAERVGNEVLNSNY